MDVVDSIENVPIRLTKERWFHIIENHNDIAGHYDDVLRTLEDPDMVLRGYRGTLIAVRGLARKLYLAVVYRQLSSDDGFVVTAYLTSAVERRKAIWKRP